MEDVENSSPNALAELSVIFAICAGKAGRCGIAYVDLDENERVLYVADVMDPEFIHLDRNTAADRHRVVLYDSTWIIQTRVRQDHDMMQPFFCFS